MFSTIALKIFAMINEGFIKSNYQFFQQFGTAEKILNFELEIKKHAEILNSKNCSLTCVFDENFPKLVANIKNSEKPFFFAYQGNLELLNDCAQNVAIIGSLYPTEDIVKRENNVVKKCLANGLNIVSGLANGCDEVAHRVCLQNGGKTIAFLPCTLDKIYPAKNSCLADEIVQQGGLIITEYVTETRSKFERIQRFIKRDRLQAMFSKSVILIASNRQGEGDSGSRHAMEKAKIYAKNRYVMYNKDNDKDNPLFGLNKDLLQDGVNILSSKSIKDLVL